MATIDSGMFMFTLHTAPLIIYCTVQSVYRTSDTLTRSICFVLWAFLFYYCLGFCLFLVLSFVTVYSGLSAHWDKKNKPKSCKPWFLDIQPFISAEFSHLIAFEHLHLNSSHKNPIWSLFSRYFSVNSFSLLIRSFISFIILTRCSFIANGVAEQSISVVFCYVFCAYFLSSSDFF